MTEEPTGPSDESPLHEAATLDDQPEPSGTRRSALLELLYSSGAKAILAEPAPDLGLAEQRPFPFMALVGQNEMRIALLLAIINPNIGGVLLIGQRGTGKTTAVRSLTGLLPAVEVSDCEEGVLPSDLANDFARSLYPDCFDKFSRGESISHYEAVKLVELPLTARIDDVVGGINERIAVQRNQVRIERGILGRADNNILYVDEVNLLDDSIIDAILDAAAQGNYTVRRGPMSGTYRSRFVLVGSMNPEEGNLRPQILDRFGLRIGVRGLTDSTERREVFLRMRDYRAHATEFIRRYEWVTAEAREEVQMARERLSETTLTNEAMDAGFELVKRLEIDSHRADYVMFEAARAHAASDGRLFAGLTDLHAVAPLALRQRRSPYMKQFFVEQGQEDEEIRKHLNSL
ncbi:MAG: ATP-binding protein [Chloroflexi bacterium]|nr:ATP-binding protein [Chloroflexota bacterium]